MDNSAERDMREKNVTNPSQSRSTKSGDSESRQKRYSSGDTSKQRTFTEPDNPPSRKGNDLSKQQTGGPGKPTA